MPWCRRCREEADDLAIIRDCDRCALPAGRSPRAHEDHGCWPAGLAVVATAVAHRYTGVVARTIATAKARDVRGAWPGLGVELLGSLRRANITRVDVVTWVPSDPSVRRRRGFDHAGLLARVVSEGLGRPAVALLRTRRRRPDQASLTINQRRALPDDAFVARGDVPGVRVLLLDDVLTSGATLRAATRALLAAGAAPVRIGVLARAGAHRLDRAG